MRIPEPTSFTGALEGRVRARAAGCRAMRSRSPTSTPKASIRSPGGTTSPPSPTRRASTTRTNRATRSRTTATRPTSCASSSASAQADLLVVHFPLWWGGMPAILKGWFDRVLAYRLRLCGRQALRQRLFPRPARHPVCHDRRHDRALLAGRRLRADRAGALSGASLHDRVSRHRGARSVHRLRGAARRRCGAAGLSRAWEKRLREIAAQPALERV